MTRFDPHRRNVAVALAALILALLPAVVLAQAAPESGRFLDVIVVFKDDAAPGGAAANRAAAAAIARDHGAAPSFVYGSALFGYAARLPEERLEAVRGDPRVAYVEFDAPVSIPTPPEATAGKPGGNLEALAQALPWGIARIGADANTNEGLGIHVYVIDTGIDSDHRDLAAQIGNGYAVVRCRGTKCKTVWDDDNGHGSHVAGTIGAIDNGVDVVGVAAAATLHAVKVLSGSGSGTRSGVIAGIDWVRGQMIGRDNAVVANMSLGGSGSKTGTCNAGGFTGADAYHQAICNAARAGVVFAVAAGNSGADAQTAVPAAYDDAVITVSATSSADNWPSWSNWGDGNATAGAPAPVQIAAPGVSVLSTWNNGATNTISGTSMATPHVAGAIALFLKTSPQAKSYSALTAARAALLGASEPTGLFANTSGHPHAESFLDASGL